MWRRPTTKYELRLVRRLPLSPWRGRQIHLASSTVFLMSPSDGSMLIRRRLFDSRQQQSYSTTATSTAFEGTPRRRNSSTTSTSTTTARAGSNHESFQPRRFLSTFTVSSGTPVGEDEESSVHAPSASPSTPFDRHGSNEFWTRIERALQSPNSKPNYRLVQKICRLQTMESLQAAQDLVEGWIVQKKKAMTLQQQPHGSGHRVDEARTAFDVVDVDIWQLLVYGWATMAPKYRVATLRMKELVDRAVEEALWDMERLGSMDEEKPLPSLPNVTIFNSYLFGLSAASNVSPSAAIRAKAHLDEMRGYHEQFGWYCRPRTKSYQHVLQAFNNSKHPDAGREALQVLHRMHEDHVQAKEEYLNRYSVPYNTKDQDANLRRIVTPDVIAYTTTMKALIGSYYSDDKQLERNVSAALRLFRKALSDPDSLIAVDAHMFCAAIHALAKGAERYSHPKMREKVAEEAERVLNLFLDWDRQRIQVETDDNSKADDGFLACCNACLDAWSKSYLPRAPLECERILKSLFEYDPDRVQPSTTSFNSCLHAWSRSNKFHSDAPDKARELLEFQHQYVLSNDYAESTIPDFQSYSIVINTLARSSYPDKQERAMQLLETMLSRVERGQIGQFRNPSAPFTAVLKTFSSTEPNHQTTRDDSTQRNPSSSDVLFDAPSDDVSNANVATTTTAVARDPFQTTLDIYESVLCDKYNIGTKLDHFFIAAMLQNVRVHCPVGSTERRYHTLRLFETAKENGMVGRSVIHVLQQMDDVQLLLLNKDEQASGKEASVAIEIPNPMPRSWSRNVPLSLRHNPAYHGKRGKQRERPKQPNAR